MVGWDGQLASSVGPLFAAHPGARAIPLLGQDDLQIDIRQVSRQQSDRTARIARADGCVSFRGMAGTAIVAVIIGIAVGIKMRSHEHGAVAGFWAFLAILALGIVIDTINLIVY